MPSRRALQQSEFGLYVLLASLAIFFAGSLAAFLLVRLGTHSAGLLPDRPLPVLLLLSTLPLFGSSACLHRALNQVRREHQRAFRRCLVLALVSGGLFCLLQAISLSLLLRSHWEALLRQSAVYGSIFLLVLLHYLHFAAGLVALGNVCAAGLRGRYDHEYHPGVKLCTIYWHFLDAVWLVMLVVFWTTL